MKFFALLLISLTFAHRGFDPVKYADKNEQYVGALLDTCNTDLTTGVLTNNDSSADSDRAAKGAAKRAAKFETDLKALYGETFCDNAELKPLLEIADVTDRDRQVVEAVAANVAASLDAQKPSKPERPSKPEKLTKQQIAAGYLTELREGDCPATVADCESSTRRLLGGKGGELKRMTTEFFNTICTATDTTAEADAEEMFVQLTRQADGDFTYTSCKEEKELAKIQTILDAKCPANTDALRRALGKGGKRRRRKEKSSPRKTLTEKVEEIIGAENLDPCVEGAAETVLSKLRPSKV